MTKPRGRPPLAETRTRCNFRLPPDVARELRRVAEATGKTQTSLLVEAWRKTRGGEAVIISRTATTIPRAEEYPLLVGGETRGGWTWNIWEEPHASDAEILQDETERAMAFSLPKEGPK